MKDEELLLWVYRQVDLLIERGYVDPSRREELEQQIYEQKKRAPEGALKMTS